MKDLILYSVITFFSIYGFISFWFFIIDFFFEIKYLKNKDFYIFINVKNEACKIESMVKGLLFKVFKNDIGIANQKIIILDSGSTDGTFDMLSLISETEKSVLVFKKEEMINFLNKIWKNFIFCFTNHS